VGKLFTNHIFGPGFESDMIARLITLSLVLSLITPLGAIGSTLHRCEKGVSARQECCDQTRLNELSVSDASGEIIHHCTLSAAAEKLPPAAVDYKGRFDFPQPADIPLAATVGLHALEKSGIASPPELFKSGNDGTRLFIRHCSFLN
jgi:hypothetical protein